MLNFNPLEMMWHYIIWKKSDYAEPLTIKDYLLYPVLAPLFLLILVFFIAQYYISGFIYHSINGVRYIGKKTRLIK